jgi:hypothetical protein
VIVSEVEEMVHFNVSWNRPDGMKIIRPVCRRPLTMPGIELQAAAQKICLTISADAS